MARVKASAYYDPERGMEWNPALGQWVEVRHNDEVKVDGNLKNELGKRKAQIQLFPAAGIIVGSDAMVEGADKYGPFNWRSGEVQMQQYLRAILAHTYAMLDGEDVDPESATGKTHLAGILASAAIIADAIEVGVIKDDRVHGPAAEMLRERVR